MMRLKVIADLIHFSSQNSYIRFMNRNSPNLFKHLLKSGLLIVVNEPKASFMEPINFPFISATISRQYLNWKSKKAFIKTFL